MSERRVLVAEDSLLILMSLEMLLEEEGISIAGSASTVAHALTLAAQGGFDIAILDINLHNEMSYPVADLLAARGIPFVFTTGYMTDSLPPRFGDALCIQKPYTSSALMALVAQAFSRAVTFPRHGSNES